MSYQIIHPYCQRLLSFRKNYCHDSHGQNFVAIHMLNCWSFHCLGGRWVSARTKEKKNSNISWPSAAGFSSQLVKRLPAPAQRVEHTEMSFALFPVGSKISWPQNEIYWPKLVLTVGTYWLLNKVFFFLPFFFACACRQITNLEHSVLDKIFCGHLCFFFFVTVSDCNWVMQSNFGNYFLQVSISSRFKPYFENKKFFPLKGTCLQRSGKISMVSLLSDTFFLSHLRLSTEKSSTSFSMFKK